MEYPVTEVTLYLDSGAQIVVIAASAAAVVRPVQELFSPATFQTVSGHVTVYFGHVIAWETREAMSPVPLKED